MPSFVLDFDFIFHALNLTSSPSNFTVDPETQPCGSLPVPEAALAAISAFYLLVFLLAVPGNLAVLAAVCCRHKEPLPPSDVYLLHLAVADLLLAATLPFWAASVLKGWLFGDAACKLVTVVQELSFYSSILFLTSISVDRYLVIVRATQVRRADRRPISWRVSALVWGLAALLSLPGFLSSSFVAQDSSRAVCTEFNQPLSADAWRLGTRVLRHSLGFLLPLLVMLPCYGVTMGRILRIRGERQRRRAMRVIVLVVAAFLLCWAPYHMAVMADTFLRTKLVQYRCPARRAVDWAVFVSQSLALLHSCINPLLYAFGGEKFRKRLQELVRRSRRRRSIVMEQVEKTAVNRSCGRSSQSSDATSTFV